MKQLTEEELRAMSPAQLIDYMDEMKALEAKHRKRAAFWERVSFICMGIAVVCFSLRLIIRLVHPS
jgi:hypothetical protein